MKKKLKLLDTKIEALIKHFKIRYYHEFIMSVVGLGLTCVYMLYVGVRAPLFFIHLETTMPYNITQAILDKDLAGVFFALNPAFEFFSLICLLGGFSWGVCGLFRHSLAKISEVDLVPLSERISAIEKEGEESDDE